jgi:hypothetical protein
LIEGPAHPSQNGQRLAGYVGLSEGGRSIGLARSSLRYSRVSFSD